ncbi:MAG: Fpg/Nei family DNA glycosylase [Promethearchaeota archaeon]
MPELPEVETFRKYFEQHGLDQEISAVSFRDATVLRNIELENFEQKLIGLHFTSTHRHGKYLFATLSSQEVVMFHFGMTGDLHSSDLPSNDFDSVFHPHDRIIFHFSSQRYLAYSSQRKFGRVELWSSVQECITQRKLGADALEIVYEDLFDAIKSSVRPIKTLLLDQKKIAGVGNLYADETLFRSGIHPLTKGSQLTSAQGFTLHQNLQEILNVAIGDNAYYGKFPHEFFIQTRKPQGLCPQCNSLLGHQKIGQRTTYFCPQCQPMK